jgi:hypothetical protein
MVKNSGQASGYPKYAALSELESVRPTGAEARPDFEGVTRRWKCRSSTVSSVQRPIQGPKKK